uniref:Uncharacterized protein n=1 Tax=Solibacter usitatus (strain Ellin6076) TaxID=234267 RepID=Q02CK5_SOLUE
MIESSPTVGLPGKNSGGEGVGLTAGWSEVSREDALAQLERIADSQQFRSSKRCSLFLRYVVQHAIDNELDCLKERSLGVAVFDRDPNYDTNQDPIVRTTAGEVRKRLAQYYLGPAHEGELRISLPTGAYMPEVHTVPGRPEPQIETKIESVDLAPSRTPRRKWQFIAAIAAVVVAAGVFALIPRKTELDKFWSPLIKAQGPIVMCVGQPQAYNFQGETQRALDQWFESADGKADPPPQIASVPLSAIVPMWDRYTGLGDAQALSRLSSVFGAYGKPFQVRGGKTTSLADLRGKPLILIGAFSNQWTMDLTGELRFHFDLDRKAGAQIVRDSQNPDKTDWQVVHSWPYWKIPVDYAIVTRVMDPTTEQVVVVAAGITHYGTQAAGELLSNPAYFADAVRHAPSGWSRKNMQIVLSAKVMSGTAGPPQILKVHFW